MTFNLQLNYSKPPSSDHKVTYIDIPLEAGGENMAIERAEQIWKGVRDHSAMEFAQLTESGFDRIVKEFYPGVTARRRDMGDPKGLATPALRKRTA